MPVYSSHAHEGVCLYRYTSPLPLFERRCTHKPVFDLLLGEQVRPLLKKFREMDKDKSGSLSKDDLDEIIRERSLASQSLAQDVDSPERSRVVMDLARGKLSATMVAKVKRWQGLAKTTRRPAPLRSCEPIQEGGAEGKRTRDRHESGSDVRSKANQREEREARSSWNQATDALLEQQVAELVEEREREREDRRQERERERVERDVLRAQVCLRPSRPACMPV